MRVHEFIQRLDQREAKDALPQAVDDHGGEAGVVLARHPACIGFQLRFTGLGVALMAHHGAWLRRRLGLGVVILVVVRQAGLAVIARSRRKCSAWCRGVGERPLDRSAAPCARSRRASSRCFCTARDFLLILLLRGLANCSRLMSLERLGRCGSLNDARAVFSCSLHQITHSRPWCRHCRSPGSARRR